ncbi:hypothetical protein ACQP3D_28880, partial [Escherichia coli]
FSLGISASGLSRKDLASHLQDVALEHTFLTLRRNYHGYNEPDDFSTQWNIAMEKVSHAFYNIPLK